VAFVLIPPSSGATYWQTGWMLMSLNCRSVYCQNGMVFSFSLQM